MKLYLVFMCGPNSLDNLRALVDPISSFFDGIVSVLHDGMGSPEDDYLQKTKGAGEVIHTKYVRRHDFSRNHYLYSGPIKNGDWCVQIDPMERLNVDFVKNLPEFIKSAKSQNINGVWYYGKPLLFEYHESLKYSGNPHEGLLRDDGGMRAIELSHQYPNEPDIRYSVRGEQRKDPYHFVGHYLKYYLFPWGSNQTLLGAEHRGDPGKVYRDREFLRAMFREELERRNVQWNTEDLIKYWRSTPIDDIMRRYINNEKILNDAYRYFILDDKTVVDEHDWVSMKQI